MTTLTEFHLREEQEVMFQQGLAMVTVRVSMRVLVLLCCVPLRHCFACGFRLRRTVSLPPLPSALPRGSDPLPSPSPMTPLPFHHGYVVA